jgi:hypothetical protein
MHQQVIALGQRRLFGSGGKGTFFEMKQGCGFFRHSFPVQQAGFLRCKLVNIGVGTFPGTSGKVLLRMANMEQEQQKQEDTGSHQQVLIGGAAGGKLRKAA